MSQFKNTSVEITTFINPHLFWVFLSEDAKKRQDLVEDLQKHVTNPLSIKNVKIGQSVLVYNGVWKRALVKEMYNSEHSHFICWLSDYGVLYNCDKVYMIPEGYNAKPTFVKQAALSGVVNVKKTLEITGFESTETIKFCAGTIQCARNRIGNARKIFFQCLTEKNGIHIGKIEILTNDGCIYDLATSLAEDGILALNKEFFLEALKSNLEVEEFHFMLSTRSNSPTCARMVKKESTESFQEIVKDIAESQGIGRGIMRHMNLKTAEITPGKKTFVEDWLKDSTKPLSQSELNYESDDSENAGALSPNISNRLPKTPENTSTVHVSPSDSVSVTTSPKSSFVKLKEALLQKKSEQRKSITSPSSSISHHDKTTDSNSPAINTSRESNRRSSEFNPLKCWSLCSDYSVDYSNKQMDSRKSDISSTSSNQKKTANSQTSSPVNISSSEILKSLLKSPGDPISKSSPIANKSDVANTSDTSSVSDKYIAILQKKFESNLSLTPEKNVDVEVSSVKSAPPQNHINWDESSKGSQNQRKLNIMPAGMQVAQQPKKEKSKVTSSSRSACSKQPTSRGVSSAHSSKPNSSPSSVTSLQKLNEYARELQNPPENLKSAVELLKQNCTQGCKCPQCKEWDADGLIVDDKDFVDMEPKKQKTCVKPTLLLKTEKDKDEVIELKSHAFVIATATKTERDVAPKLVAHGHTLPSPIISVTSVPFHVDIHRALRLFEQVYTIQSYVWPCIMRHNNICMVSAPKSGKSMAYLPAICSYLLERQERYGELPSNTISPIAIILCPGCDVANNVHNLMLKLIDHCPNKPACVFAVPPVDKKCLNQFQKQCDILITTPVTLISLLRTRIITVKRLCHLVMESGDKILDKFFKEIDSLLNLVQSMLEHRNCSLSMQMIVSAEHWTLPLENLMKRLCITPVVCIGSHLESALYGRVDIQMQFLESKNKMHTLAELLKNTSTVCKTVVICNNDSEIEEAKEYLNSSGVNTALMYDTMDKQEIIDLETKWSCSLGGKHLALLCTDKVFNNTLTISDAVMLVNYSLPDTWTQFSTRFSCLLDNYLSPLATKVPNDWVRCKVHIFVDEACTKQFPKLIQLLQRMGVKLSTNFIEYYKQSIKIREEEKLASKIKLCSNVKLFGKCFSDNRQLYQTAADSEVFYSSLNCKRRHILSVENDYSNNLPKCGVIKFKIIHVQNIATYTIKMLEHTDSEGKTHKWNNHENLDEELHEAMSEQRICVFDVKLGGLYVLYSEEDESYQRCTVQKILHVEKITRLASLVSIRCLDSGVEKRVVCSFLYELPEKFRNIPAQGIDVILANTVPPDSDESWSSCSKPKVIHMLKEAGYQDEEVYGIGQILLQLGNVIWVKNILLREKLIMVDTIVTKLNIRKSLKDQNLVHYSEEPLEGLYSLCKNSGIELPDFNKLPAAGKELENKSKQQVQPQWAYFDDCDCNEIYISVVCTPALFYVRLKKFYSLFENFQKEIQEVISKPFYPNTFEVECGKYYLAKDFAGDDYCRVKVIEIRENIAECFYVDFGDYASVNVADIKYLTDPLIVKLPFQVIECRLYGVLPAWGGGDWEQTAINLINDYIFEPGTDYFRTLYTTTCKQEPATSTGGQRCAILLVDNFKENKIILLNQLLIDCGEAVNVESEDLDKEFNIPEEYEEPDDVDDDVKNKELTIEDVKRFTAKYKTDDDDNNNNDNDTNVNKSKSFESSGSENSWDIVIDDPETFMKLLIGAKVNNHPPINIKPELPPMKALAFSDHYTPNVVWFQTSDLISFSIMLPDLKDYILRVARNRMIMFKAKYDEKQYCLDLQLYDKVKTAYKYKTYGQYLKVLLTKCVPVDWPRLISSSERMRNITYDVSRLIIPEDEKKTFLKFNVQDEDVQDDQFEIDIGSDENYSESDVESFSSD